MSRIYNPLLRKIKPKIRKKADFLDNPLSFLNSQIGVLLEVCSWFVRVSFESASKSTHKLRTNHEQT